MSDQKVIVEVRRALDPTGIRVTLQRERIKCGKASCKRCPHGPYWYGYWTSKEGKTRTRYIGKALPEAVVKCLVSAADRTLPLFPEGRRRGRR